MKTFEFTTQFKRDYKRKKSAHRHILNHILGEVLTALANGSVLHERHRDHALIGNWSDHRDCHIKSEFIGNQPQIPYN